MINIAELNYGSVEIEDDFFNNLLNQELLQIILDSFFVEYEKGDFIQKKLRKLSKFKLEFPNLNINNKFIKRLDAINKQQYFSINQVKFCKTDGLCYLYFKAKFDSSELKVLRNLYKQNIKFDLFLTHLLDENEYAGKYTYDKIFIERELLLKDCTVWHLKSSFFSNNVELRVSIGSLKNTVVKKVLTECIK